MHITDISVTSRNLEKVIIGAYRWLSDTYRPGDQIFLFGTYQLAWNIALIGDIPEIGFSRGAYQVRALAAMIHRVSVAHPTILEPQFEPRCLTNRVI